MAVPRSAIQGLFQNDPQLALLGVQAVYGSNSIDSPPEECFLVVHWEGTTKSFSVFGSSLMTVWCHDRQRDYSYRVQPALERIKEIFQQAYHIEGDDGVTLTCATWNMDSDDLIDDGYNTITKNSSYTLSGRVS